MAHPLVPLLVLIIVILAAAAIGYVVITIANDIADKTSKKMEKHHVSFTKDGMKVGVKEVKDEDYKSQTQRSSSVPPIIVLSAIAFRVEVLVFSERRLT